jgi:hypothetical protein
MEQLQSEREAANLGLRKMGALRCDCCGEEFVISSLPGQQTKRPDASLIAFSLNAREGMVDRINSSSAGFAFTSPTSSDLSRLFAAPQDQQTAGRGGRRFEDRGQK